MVSLGPWITLVVGVAPARVSQSFKAVWSMIHREGFASLPRGWTFPFRPSRQASASMASTKWTSKMIMFLDAGTGGALRMVDGGGTCSRATPTVTATTPRNRAAGTAANGHA